MHTVIGTDINKAAQLLTRSDVVAIPTETVYGLAGNALDEEAVLKIYEAKGRPHFNPLIIHVASAENIKQYAKDIPAACHDLAKTFSPGPITFLLNKKQTIPDLVTAGSDKVAVRIPDHPLTLQLLNQLDFPLAAPSANPFGYVSPVTAQHVYDGLHGKIPYILDGGPCGVGVESTIVGFDEKDNIIIHRLGGISTEEIEQLVKKKVTLSLLHQQPHAPGQLKSHYATGTALYLGNIPELLKKFAGKKIAVLSFEKKYPGIEPSMQFQLSPSGDIHEAARNLFRLLRHVDRLGADVILTEPVPEEGLGAAINDRLIRAQKILKN
ncbi:MAG: L-threonylcarbamoyladenylate synthase [Chitinophagaceae bacterium]|nr:L-threonylcarbamoyladenylate synthase [Chitinophagaceae bacterium]